MTNLLIDQHFESLLESSATDRIIELKIDKLLAGPHGYYICLCVCVCVHMTLIRCVIN